MVNRMNILVVCVNAENGGGEKILRMYCEEYEKDISNTYYICTSLLEVENKPNIINLRFPQIKKSYFHRAFFDLFKTKELISKYSIDKIISLQSIGVFNKKLPQTLYIQQALPFANKKYGISEDFKYWFYQNIYFAIMKRSIKYVDQIIVQTQWMKRAIIKETEFNSDGIIVETPKIENKYDSYFDNSSWNNKFFYPTSYEEYKNYEVIFKAVENIGNKLNDYKIVLTLNKEDLNNECLQIYNRYSHNFELIGYINEEQLHKHYVSSILIFPSIVESLGLPILEAMSVKTTIIASDVAYARELLENYDNKIYFDNNDYKQLSNIIMDIVKK